MKRVISLVLSVALVLSFVLPATSASSHGGGFESVRGVVYDNDFYARLDSELSGFLTGGLTKSHLWRMFDCVVNYIGYGQYSSLSDLNRACVMVNQYFSTSGNAIWDLLTDFDKVLLQTTLTGISNRLVWVICQNSTYGYVIMAQNTNIVLCNSSGAFPYYKEEVSSTPDPEPAPGTTPPSDGSSSSSRPCLGGTWTAEEIIQRTEQCSLVPLSSLQSLCNDINNSSFFINGERAYVGDLDSAGCFKVIYYDEPLVKGLRFVYCNSSGIPYTAQTGNFAVNTPNNYYTDSTTNISGDTIYNNGDTTNTTFIDQSTSTVWFPDGTLNYIDQLIYDMSTKTYYVDAHQSYNIDFNYYITNNYKYEYHIDYTSITYIGSTAEYDKTYEFYYELPDGRSSADLTAEELKTLNTSVDVVSYVRSADDVSVRALYHFDGDTLDSSYWNYLGSFKWLSGASITYMDANAFHGALYLDENVHNFTITLPSNITSEDFTLQFRYYQSHTETPSLDSYVVVGGTKLFQFNGVSFYNGSGGTITTTSIGTWQEICIMRSSGTVYWYVNGVRYGSVANATSLTNVIQFYFGSAQQTYKYIDEFRFTNKAIYSASYVPSSVPFDTNLALVLPDSYLPVADEYWEFTSSKTNLLAAYNLANWAGQTMTSVTRLRSYALSPSAVSADSSGEYYRTWTIAKPTYATYKYPYFLYDSAFTTVGSYPDSGFISSRKYTFTPFSGVSTSYSFELHRTPIPTLGPYSDYYVPSTGIYSCLSHVQSGFSGQASFSTLADGEYTLSMVAMDGTVGSVTFTLPFQAASSATPEFVSTSFNGYQFGVESMFIRYRTYNESTGKATDTYCGFDTFLYISPIAFGNVSQFLYLELVKGSGTDLKAEKITAIAPVNSDFRTPTLAVRTDQVITGYQIGGMRPSLPRKGFVWALVEDGRITSVQVYNGQAWEAVDGRIWTGSRWVPYYAYDIILLNDMYDIIESDPSQDVIISESGFWSWLQRAWTQMMNLLQKILDAILSLAGISPGDSPGDEEAPPGDSGDTEDPTPSPEDYTGIVHLLRVSYGFFSGFFSFTMDGVENFIVFFTDADSDAFKIFNLGWDD